MHFLRGLFVIRGLKRYLDSWFKPRNTGLREHAIFFVFFFIVADFVILLLAPKLKTHILRVFLYCAH